MFILGIMESQSAAAAGDFESIATVTVGAGGSSTITFSSIPSTYQHLQLRAIHKQPSTGIWATIEYNSDTTASNYAYHRVYGDGATAAAQGGTSSQRIFTSYQYWGNCVIDILDYALTNKYKTARVLFGLDNNGSGEVALLSNLWMSTAAINSIKLNVVNATQYSHFALYGIKG